MSNFYRFKTGVNLGSLASDPGTADPGDFYYNTTSEKLKLYTNQWNEIPVGSELEAFLRLDGTSAMAPGASLKFRNTDDTLDVDVMSVFQEALTIGSGSVTDISIGSAGTISLATDADVQLNPGVGQFVNVTNHKIINVSNPTNNQDAATKNYVDTQISALPNPLVYVGTWDASTNTPTLTNGTGTQGNLYQVSVGGTVDFGAGPITFSIGDKVVYNGSIWEKWDNTDEVLSVNGQTGIVVLNTDDISEGSTNFYYTEGRFDTSLAGKSTDNLAEGGNLYFTDLRAQTAAVVNTLAGSETTQAPSVSAVNSALDTYLPLSGDSAMTGELDMGTFNIINVADPVNDQDVATKNYVDSISLSAQYYNSLTLTASQTNTVLPSFTFAHGTYEALIIEYKIKESTTNALRVGTLYITSNGTATSIDTNFTETADVGVIWDLNINGSNTEVRYTTTANDKIMKALVKRIEA